MKNKSRCIKILAGIILALVLASFVGLFIYQFQFNKTYAATYKDKLERLETLEGEKAVFVGGSSCMFGVHTSMFEEATGIQSVNMAVSAGIPMKFYLDSISPYLHEGDKLFLCFEYSYYNYEWDMVGESGINFILYQDSSVLSTLSAKSIVISTPDIITVGWKDWENTIQEFIKNDLLGGYGVYTRYCTNDQGDMIAHEGIKGESLNDDTSEQMVLDEESTLIYLAEYIQNLSEKGIDVYYVSAPVTEKKYQYSEQFRADLMDYMENMEWITVLTSPEDAVYDVSCFFDTVDHLNYATGVTHTERIIDNYLSLVAEE